MITESIIDESLKKYVDKFNAEHEEFYKNMIPNSEAANWMNCFIPLFECDDSLIEEKYYFRFWALRKHIKSTPDGTVITEFLPDVPWSGPYNTIVCPLGQHIAEARWLNDRSIIESDIRFFLKTENTEHAINYSSSFLWEIFRYIKYSGNVALAKELLDGMIRQYEAWEQKNGTRFDLFWSFDGADGMEYSVSGNGLRPTLNTYLYGAAVAISEICNTVGDSRAEVFCRKAEQLYKLIHKYLWDEKENFYKTVPMDNVDSEPDFERRNPDRNVKEEVGFLPFTVPGLCTEEQEKAFSYLTDKAVFSAPCGITTADMSHPLFMKNPVHHECLWDGPVWPYSTCQTLTAVYTVLAKKNSNYINQKDYMKLLRQYAFSQRRYDGTKWINWIDENIDPFSGQWISRDLIYLDHSYDFPLERGADYNHSSFCDLVLSGACGILPDTDLITGKQTLTVKPLCTEDWSYYAVRNLSIGSSVFEVYYDKNKTKYGYGSVLTLIRDGKPVASGNYMIQYEL